MKRYLIKCCAGTGWFTCLFLLLSTICQARQDGNTWPEEKGVKIMKVTHASQWWNLNTQLNPFRLPPPPLGADLIYIDLTGDGRPNVLRTILPDGTPIQWIDDDGDMEYGDLAGDTDNDCLMIDRNRDGEYGSYGDLIIDWVDTDNDGKADIQIVVDNINSDRKYISGGGHYMMVFDTDKDNIFNYIDWNTYELRCWLHTGMSDFYTDYHGNSTFLKIHATPERMNDVRLNWENPFLFFDPDKDGLTEMTVRLCDSRYERIRNSDGTSKLSAEINWAAISVDMDNDNTPENPFDLDMTINFQGKGVDYSKYKHFYKNMRGLPEADGYFLDPAWRQNSELIFPERDQVFDFIFREGTWDAVWFTFDEDGDCKRWERVELYQPLDLYKTGADNGGLDNHIQADVIGDRGEWDMDNSGHGNLYISPMDGKIHLYGAEWGAWRIDQRSEYYQNMGGIYDIYGPGRQQGIPAVFPVVKYEDTDNNGFFDKISFDFDGDQSFEETISLKELGIDDTDKIWKIKDMKYRNYTSLFSEAAERMWKNAKDAVKIARKEKIDLSWYAYIMHPKSIRQKYEYGWWLQLYIYHDLKDQAERENNAAKVRKIQKAYFSGQKWNQLNK